MAYISLAANASLAIKIWELYHLPHNITNLELVQDKKQDFPLLLLLL